MERHTLFRPCIDLHDGRVKQIIGGTLSDTGSELRTNFSTDLPARHFASLYRDDRVHGGHVIMLGKGNDAAACDALSAWPDGLQIGGGITEENAASWLAVGASHVIVTSRIFSVDGKFLPHKLAAIVAETGRDKLVLDLSCRRVESGWVVAMNRWQTLTDMAVTTETLNELSGSCAEFLIHAADVEGQMAGMDEELIQLLGSWRKIPVTYAGGAATTDDLRRCHLLSKGHVDLTIGSALDIFGGKGVRYQDCVAWNRLGPAFQPSTAGC